MEKTLQEQLKEIEKQSVAAKEALVQEVLDRVAEEFGLSRTEKKGKKDGTSKKVA